MKKRKRKQEREEMCFVVEKTDGMRWRVKQTAADSKLLNIHHLPEIPIFDPSLTILVTKKGHDSINC